jgi:alkyldihydroxyacetonephosphate synthase
MAHMSHAYPDGCCIYFTFAASDDNDAEAEKRYDETWRAALAAVLDAGGTLSHHHGVGRSKAPRMGDELGLGVEIVAALERAFDPAGIMNPKNLLPAEPPARRPLPTAPSAPELDASSELVHAAGTASLADVERCAAAHGLTLGIDPGVDLERETVAAWLARGAPGSSDPWLDPVDHLVAGYAAELPKGGALVVRPCPRRAVGPDLFALFFGTGTRAGRIHSAHLRAKSRSAESLDTPLERDPPIGDDERRWIDRALAAAAEC